MEQQRVQRRLAAIIAADVVGYSRMMHADETRTRAQFNAHFNELLLPAIASHGGRIFKTMGDGLLAEFPSVVEAVECAAGVQSNMARRNAREPEERRFNFRIGVNIGDVIVEGDDIHGDGVNIAARLEAIAAPGSVFLSGEAVGQVAGKTDLTFSALGDHQLKNIDRPVAVHCLAIGATNQQHALTGNSGPSAGQDTPSIAVLPFENLSPDKNDAYFSDGISEEVIAALSHIDWLFVIARSTSFAYARRAHDPRAVAGELNVDYVLSGTVRRASNRVRVSTELVDGASGHRLWSERFDRELADIFALQDEIAEAIAGAIEPALVRSEQARAREKRNDDLRAWDLYQRAMWHSWKLSSDDLSTALKLLEQARAADPNLVQAYAGAVEIECHRFILGFCDDGQAVLEDALILADHAIRLDGRSAQARYAKGRTLQYLRRHDEAIPELRLALEINPNFAWAHYALGNTLATSGHAEEGIPHFEKAMRLSPQDPQIGQMMARTAEAYYFLGDFEAALAWARKSLQQPNIRPSRWATLIATLGQLGRLDEVPPAREALHRLEPQYSTKFVRERFPIAHQPSLERLLEGLSLAGFN